MSPPPSNSSDQNGHQNGHATSVARLSLVRILTSEQAFITAYAFAIVRDHHLAEDVFQEVAVILAEHWETVPVNAPRPWLKEMVRRKSLEVARRARRHVLLSDETLIALAGAFPDATPDSDDHLKQAMADCVKNLPDHVREVIDGRYRDNLSCEDVADRLGKSIQSIYATIKRSRSALSDCVKRATMTDLTVVHPDG